MINQPMISFCRLSFFQFTLHISLNFEFETSYALFKTIYLLPTPKKRKALNDILNTMCGMIPICIQLNSQPLKLKKTSIRIRENVGWMSYDINGGVTNHVLHTYYILIILQNSKNSYNSSLTDLTTPTIFHPNYSTTHDAVLSSDQHTYINIFTNNSRMPLPGHDRI